MLSPAQRDAYERDGFIVVPDVFLPAEIDELRRVTDEFVRNAPRSPRMTRSTISKTRIRATSRASAG